MHFILKLIVYQNEFQFQVVNVRRSVSRCCHFLHSDHSYSKVGTHFEGHVSYMGLWYLTSTFMVHCRLLHLTLLIFNSIAVRSLSIISGGEKSTFSREENANALILVASQVKTQSVTITFSILTTYKIVILHLILSQKNMFSYLSENITSNGSSYRATLWCIWRIWITGSSLYCNTSNPGY